VRVDVGDGRDVDAWRLDDVDGVDPDARTDVARRCGVVPWHVGRDDPQRGAGDRRPAAFKGLLWRYEHFGSPSFFAGATDVLPMKMA
jgi:hypothetical protein